MADKPVAPKIPLGRLSKEWPSVSDMVLVKGPAVGTPHQTLISDKYYLKTGKVIGITGELYSVMFSDTNVLEFTLGSIELFN